MREVGVRELKAHASEIVRAVRDERARYTVTYRGRPVGILMPLPAPGVRDDDERISWSELSRRSKVLTENWSSPLTTTEILSEMRR
jgi:prevent-host-death family protein